MKTLPKILMILSISLFLSYTSYSQGNTSYGTAAGSTGAYTSSFGERAGDNNGGDNNSYFGYYAGKEMVNGDNNSFFGFRAGNNNEEGDRNSFFGSYSGYNNIFGSDNVFIGYNAGYNETGSNKLYIDNTNTSSPLIWGDFSSNQIKINGAFESTGTITASGTVHANNGIQIDGVTVIDNGGGWHRSYGATGWYNGSYGGGIYMSDATWIRTYGNKSFYHNTGVMRTDGTLQVGGNGSRFIVQTNGTVGINTTSPSSSYKLDVNGSIRATGGNSSNWNTAYSERGSQIAGTGLSWSGGKLNVSSVNTDDQTLTLVSNTLSIESGNSVSLSSYLDNTDSQDLQLSGNTLSLSGDATSVNLSSYLDNTDDQGIDKLNLNGATLELSLEGDGVADYTLDLSSLNDNMGDHTATQNILPDVTRTHDLGSGTKMFRNMYFDSAIYKTGAKFIHSEGSESLFIGSLSGQSILSGSRNTAIGRAALYSLTNGDRNVAIGYYSLFDNVVGDENVAIGYLALSNSTADYNTAIGSRSLENNTTGGYNNAFGIEALRFNTTGIYNSGFGDWSLKDNTTGSYNVGIGSRALDDNTEGSLNTAVGNSSLSQNTIGDYNTALGRNSLSENITGDYNTAIGYLAGPAQDSSFLNNTTAIGNGATVLESNHIVIGNTSVTSIGGEVSWSTLSDGRFKKNVKENVPGLKFINKLRPVSYNVDINKLDRFLGVNTKLDENGTQTYKRPGLSKQTIGFVAQEVQELIDKDGYVFSGVDKPNSRGGKFSIRYAEFVVPLTKAVQELSEMIETQQATIDQLNEELIALKKQNGGNEKSPFNQSLNEGFKLEQNKPNPFSVETSVDLNLPNSIINAELVVYDLQGRQLKTIPVNSRGAVRVNLKGHDLDPGMYVYALIADGNIIGTNKMILKR